MNQMRCISFIGPGVRDKKRYCMETTCIETDLVQEAIWGLYQPEEIIVCLSDPMAASLAAELDGRGILTRKLWIPYGTHEDQLWEIFSLLCGVVRDGEKILFDITAGCHSLPFITFLTASYLRSVRNVKITGVIYAPGTGDDGFCRFVDLKPLMHVLDWISGIHAVTHYNDAKPVKALLSGMQNTIHRSGDDPSPPVRMSSWASLLENFSDAVRLARPVDALYAAEGIVNGIGPVSDELSRYAPSLIPVIAGTKSLSGLAGEPEPSGCSYEYAEKQIRLIEYQIEKGLYLQAVTLGREVLITLVMIRIGKGGDWRDADIRHTMSRTLTGGALALQQKNYEKTGFSENVAGIFGWKEMVQIWLRISDLRNNLAHCGMNQRDDSVRSIRRRASDILPDLERFRELCETTDEKGEGGPQKKISRDP